MNFGRDFPIPPARNGDPWTPVTPGKPIPQNGIGQNRGSWATSLLEGAISQANGIECMGNFSVSQGNGNAMPPERQIPVDGGIISEILVTPRRPIPMGNGIPGSGHSWTTSLQESGIVHNSYKWNPVMQENSFPPASGTVQSMNSWNPVTPGKPIPQRSNMAPVQMQENQLENENWQDLLGIYKDLLQEETLDLNVLQDLTPTPPPPAVQSNRNQNASTAKRNLNPSLSFFPTQDPANWKSNILETVVGPTRSTTYVSSTNVGQKGGNGIHVSSRPVDPNPSTQVRSNSMSSALAGSMLGSRQTRTFTSNQLIHNGFPDPYCCNLNSPPRSEPDAASSSVVGSFPVDPITPDNQGRHVNNRVPEKVNLSIEEISTPVKDGRGQTVSIRSQDANNHLQTMGDSTSSTVSTTQKEHIVSVEGNRNGNGQAIDLNETPQQKTPARRKKHRPKVIREGKPKRMPKPKDPRNGNSDETRVKRKYERRKGLKVSETPQGNGVEVPKSVGKRKYLWKKGIDGLKNQQKSRGDETSASAVETPNKTVKKRLNFDLESVAKDESQQGLSVNAKPTEPSLLKTSKMAQQNGYVGETTKQEIFSKGQTQTTGQNMSLTELNAPREHALNVIARNMTMRNPIPGTDFWRNRNNPVNQHIHGGRIGNNVGSTHLERAREPKLQDMLNLDGRRGIKRQTFDMDSLLMYQKLLLGAEPHNDDIKDLASFFLEGHKKKKMQSDVQVPVSTEPSRVVSLEGSTKREAMQNNGVYGNGSALHLLQSCTGRVNPSCKLMNDGRSVANRHFQPPMAAAIQIFPKHQVLSGMQYRTQRSIAEGPQRSTQGHGISSVTAMVRWNTQPKENSGSAVGTYSSALLEKNATANPNSSGQRLNGVQKTLQQHHNALESHQRPSPAKGRGRKQKLEVSVDDVINFLEGLCIYDENERAENALVPYKGDNAMIPFEPNKKRKPRPKVDLDPETDRLWRLLMYKEGSEGTETLDKDKEKWWEEERRVFRGRADSFIARMHLVQGDRRFSRWKGSVVDSVIGVFLTQNVTDHLSSSAFMSLAAKFPIETTPTNKSCCQDRAHVLFEEPIGIKPNDRTNRHENIISQPVFNQTFFVSSDSSEHTTHRVSATKGASNKHKKIPEGEVILSQESFDSSTIQTADEIRSSSGSNSEVDDLTIGFETSKESCPEKPSLLKELFGHDNLNILLNEPCTNMPHFSKNGVDNLNSPSGFTPTTSNIHLTQESLAFPSHFQTSMQNTGSLCFGLLGGESTSSMPSSNSGVTEAYQTSNVTYRQNDLPRFRAPPLHQYDFLSSQPTHQENLHRQQGRGFFTELIGHDETLGKGKNSPREKNSAEDRVSVADKHNFLQNTAAEASSKERKHSPSGVGTNTSKAKKGTAEDEKNIAFDWDSLRKQALSSGEKRERSKDAMDSLDYEALRHAHVNEISDAIRERGMNNLLADRIKDFLNRLVRDHGSIDLEWLRDAPPDKVKDYLLSIRGLGLKSVECVRLLTLHHLAFPVDTNVGRIAVRLGWVPLQPLPESLQLHLLEMYPVLESIQKYLWPRLCKLDQLTLYELHYQMITFGKVFCTKSKPNCNACPMRAECRHFASAFASARLALPGPEEKRIVTSDAPTAPDKTPPVVGRPMPLPPAENNHDKDAVNFGTVCEPIIEEPTTPEPETAELSISDIEDQYYEDSDEIPTIKLNMEEFTTNLQNIMQDSTELQGDMSKALVALNPKAASIPTPKLKNVSRLRTEHQVYELPDSHPLLEGLEKREPDDPSPYLLAIWTPGETANSTQIPERGCPAQESGKLCDRATCFSCNSIKEANSQVVRGTILIPCRTATRGSFPLNGTYFQVNEMFADHASSLNPIDVPRAWVWNLPRRTVYFGTSVSTIFKGLTTEGIQYCFWRGFVCVRGFDRKTRAPRPLMARLHFPASKMLHKTKNEGK